MGFDELAKYDVRDFEDELDAKIPAGWSLRPGDAEPFEIFQFVGHALTRWERVEVSLLEALLALQLKDGPSNKIIRKYSKQRDILNKLRLMFDEFKRHSKTQKHLSALEPELINILKEYCLWKTARNRIAHGVVIQTGSIMMDEVENGMIATYQLHPSEADQRNWLIPWRKVEGIDQERFHEGDSDDDYINDGPIFSYRAADIAKMNDAFLTLDRKFVELSKAFRGGKTKVDGPEGCAQAGSKDLSI